MAVRLLFLLLLFRFFPFTSSTISSLSNGRSLSVENANHVLSSPNGIFSAGFYPVGESAYCFAIWFNMKSYDGSLIVVWMANRDQPVNGRGSKLSLLKSGNLILTDAGQFPVWATSTSSTSSLRLQLHNSGNLVLDNFQGRGVPLWQSFDSPTDTLLPGQPLTRYVKLVSSRSKYNMSSGYYKLLFDDDNILRLIFDGSETSSIYWPDPWLLSNEAGRSRYNDTRIAVFDSRGYFRSSDRVEFTSIDFGLGPKRRLTLDFDGNLRLYSFDESKKSWSVSWQAMSKPCRIHNACGPNGICSYDPAFGRKCSCPPGYEIKNRSDWSFGCKPEFNLQHKNGDVMFVGLSHTDFYGYNIEIIGNSTFENCTKKCLELKNCKGFRYNFNEDEFVYNCYPKWQLRNGHSSPDHDGAMYVKLPKTGGLFSNSYNNSINEFKLDCSVPITKLLDRDYQQNHTSVASKYLLWVACAIGGIEAFIIILVCYFLHRRQRVSVTTHGYLYAVTGFKRFTYAELKKATQDFTEEIGRGGAGVVYKGVLFDQRVAAIKRLSEANQGEAEFLSEVNTIGRINHKNLIEMWGYCAEGKHRLLVYEYMEQGSLADKLQSSNALDWDKRFKIAIGTAKGLAYLHEECLEWVLHCDVKPQNILLDSDYQPKVSDFGLSKLLSRHDDHQHNISGFSRIRGTRGYMAPEWVFNLPITSKVDVYSYGVVLLEMLTGRTPTLGVHTLSNNGEAEHGRLVTWVRERNKGSLVIREISESLTDDTYDRSRIEILIEVALHCVEDDRDARPTMTQVVEKLVRGLDQ